MIWKLQNDGGVCDSQKTLLKEKCHCIWQWCASSEIATNF